MPGQRVLGGVFLSFHLAVQNFDLTSAFLPVFLLCSMKFCDNCYTFLCYSIGTFLILLGLKDNAKVYLLLYTILIYFHNFAAIIFMNPFILRSFLYTVHLYTRYQHIFRYNYTIIIDNNFSSPPYVRENKNSSYKGLTLRNDKNPTFTSFPVSNQPLVENTSSFIRADNWT